MSAVGRLSDYGLSQKATKASLFSKIGIVGCGKEGQNIARMAAANGLEVRFVELSQDKIDAAIDAIDKQLNTRIENWGLTNGEKRTIMGRISGATSYGVLKDCDFVIEAVLREQLSSLESIVLRKTIFEQVESVVREDCIIATNAATVIVSELSSSLKVKERCVSLHFFIDSPDARIVEVVRGLWTSEEVYAKVCGFVAMLRRQVIPVNDSVGLVGVRVIVTMINEACDILMEGVASLEDIDKTMEVGYGMRHGIFQLADIIGLDKIERWGENLFNEFGKISHKPSPLIKRLVHAKQYGTSTGCGFFTYDAKGKTTGVSVKRFCQ
jgi:3-hydroxybutyryl-CoA dehydrogenase